MRVVLLALCVTVALVGCDGSVGPEGPTGQAGTNGATGLQGPPGAGIEVPAGYTAADGIAGGAAYSKWWTSDGGGGGTQPTTTVAADFYRCKACHAWDGLGNSASYASRTGQVRSRPPVRTFRRSTFGVRRSLYHRNCSTISSPARVLDRSTLRITRTRAI